jgi:enterochelin esterase family protein
MKTQKAKGFPEIDHTRVEFIYSGAVKDRIAVTGDHMHWSAVGEVMNTLEGTDFHYLGKHFEPDARLDYKFIVDGEWIIDPLNPHVCAGGFGLNSEVRMPQYVPSPDIEPLASETGGVLQTLTVKSRALSSSRELQIYLPAAYNETSGPFPVIFFNDGPEYLSLAMAKHVLDNNIASQKIDPVVAIFVPPENREQEFRLTKLEAYAKFIVQEVMPIVRTRWNITLLPAQCAIIGASDGGHAALWLSLEHPAVFGMAGMQSATITDRLILQLEKSRLNGRRFALDCGRYDLTGFLEEFHIVSELLRSRGGNVSTMEWNEGHSWGNWRAHLGSVLQHLFPCTANDSQMSITQ